MKSWKTNVSGIAILVAYVLSYIWPQHKDFFIGLMPLLAAAGFFSAKDSTVTGGTTSQPTVPNPAVLTEKK